MRTIKYKFLGALLLTVALAVSSCVKNNGYADTINDSNKFIAEISEAGAEDINSLALNAVPVQEDVVLCEVRIGSKVVPNKAFTIKLKNTPTLITEYNTANSTSYVDMPASAFTGSYDIVIPAGKRAANMVIKINKAGLDLSKEYAIGLTVASVDGGATISSTAKNLVVGFLIKNQYDGDYASSGTRYNFNSSADAPNNYVSTAPWSFDTHVATVGATTCAVQAANSNGGFGTINITVNADNTVTVASTPATGLNALVPTAGKTSTYNPTTKTFHLYYEYTNTSGTFRLLDHVLVRK
jgi:Domain of unknown function (DUF1735)/Domain of unknown function (DUF4361)